MTMVFGRKNRKGDRPAESQYDDDQYTEDYAEYDEVDYDAEDFGDDYADQGPGDRTGPYDYDDVADRLETVADQRLDLGSVIVPVPPGGQLQVEMTPDGTPQAVHLATQHGRITVAAYAAPKSPGQWRAVAADLAETLRKDGAQVSVQNGPWGRELHAVTEGADLRFIGVDGHRWMVRLVAAGPSGSADDNSPLVAAARTILGETVVRRGDEPLPVREPLPVVLPQELADQLAAAHQQQLQAQQQAMAAQLAAMQGGQPYQGVTPPANQEPRRGAEGSAMQQLGLN
ncbi:DUF3710 domain-containing protein [Nocardia huaxiensis]|nr:DUF3710 domain-containing protein [Nocardia huaxiensis]UFS97151.1 DUF3710 domain-containing protein [Nocardia huaxiensis]